MTHKLKAAGNIGIDRMVQILRHGRHVERARIHAMPTMSQAG